MILVYKNIKNDSLLFVEDTDNLATSLIGNFTFKHIATIEPSIILSKIYNICKDNNNSDVKINHILKVIG